MDRTASSRPIASTTAKPKLQRQLDTHANFAASFRQDMSGMQMSTLPSLQNSASGPMSANNSQTPPYSQSAQYGHQIQFSQQQLHQGTANGLSNGNSNVSAAFPSSHLQSSIHQQGLPGAHTHMQNFANTGTIPSDNMLPASVVNDPSATASNQFAGQRDALNSNNTWSDAHTGIPGGNVSYRVPQSFGHPAMSHRQQNGMLPPFANGRNSAPGSSMGLAQNTGLHSNMNGHSVLGHMGGPLSTMNGLHQQGQNLVPIGIGQQFGEDGSGGRSYGQIDAITNSMRGGGKMGRPYDHHSTGYSHPIGNIAGLQGLTDVPIQSLGENFPASGVKTEDSSACGPRRPRSRKRGNKPPGTPSIPVHLRNPKKGRARVFRKCQYCNHDNHIRRSLCYSCKQGLPPGKRRRDGNLSYQREHAAKQRVMAAGRVPAPVVPFATGTAQSVPQPVAPQAPPAPLAAPAPRPADVNGPN